MWEHLWDFFVDTFTVLFMPLVCSYYAVSGNVFLNVSAQNATGLEWVGNSLLSPVQYLLAGKEAIETPQGWEFVQRFDYQNHFWLKATTSLLALPSSLILGSAVKGLSLVGKVAREHHQSLFAAVTSTAVRSNREMYRKWGIDLDSAPEFFCSQGHQRRPGDEKVLAVEKKALQDIASVFNEAGIPWWVDCGTCMGAYRYGGVIPWDGDIDIAVLLPDFENVCKALNRLEKTKYIVQDWSTREHPKSFLKVYIRETGTLMDIYHFAIDADRKELNYVFSLESCLFFPEWCKVRERRFTVPAPFEIVFPLKKANFDGVEIFIPNDPHRYLQRCYGENLAPAKIYDPNTGRYEKDLSHPYWQRAFAH